MNKILFLFIALTGFVSCKEKSEIPPQIDTIPVELTIKRFDQDFARAQMESLPRLKKDYPYLFSKRYPDAYWLQKITDTIQQEINYEVSKAFPDFTEEEEDIQRLFKFIKYYFPATTIPKIITLTTDVDYKNKIVLADSLLFIGLDTYLGAEHHFYTGIPAFQSKNFRKEQLVIDIAAAFARNRTPRPRQNDFLSEIIYEGKKLFLMKSVLLDVEEQEILGYTQEELSFANENRRNVWEFFIKNELLYSTDRKLLSRFVNPAPFSKFYLSFDNETPGRIGRYVGYEIVKSYMQETDTPLQTMLVLDAETIFTNAKYKP